VAEELDALRQHERLLDERLKRQIDTEGPLTFAEFMEAALYDPDDGFYARPPVGEQGHFVTSPHVSPVFGELLARQLEQFWNLMDRPDRFDVIEAGAGDGMLARQLLSSLGPEMAGAVRYVPVERSVGQQAVLRRAGLDSVASLDQVEPAVRGCVLANELLDNLPFHLIRRGDRGVVEVRIGLDERGEFGFVDGDPSRPELSALAADLTIGEQAVVSPAAIRFVEESAGVLARGYVLIVDYGFTSGERATAPHGYRGHRLDADVLKDPGSRDITAGVDFEALARTAQRLGLTVWGPVTQREALMNLGFRELEEEARTRQVAAIAARRGIDALRTYSDRTRANLLLARAGLGDFLVLCLGKGMDRPPRSIRQPDRRFG
jgi:SAM-dependent MidA family methyltransferase